MLTKSNILAALISLKRELRYHVYTNDQAKIKLIELHIAAFKQELSDFIFYEKTK